MSGIEWTDRTWNPMTGCSRVSPGCDRCYMFARYPRLHAMGAPGYAGAPDVVTLLDERVAEPEKWRKPRRVFVNSMSDTFHPAAPFEFIDRLFEVMARTPHTYQLLTKRPGRAVAWWKRSKLERWPANVWIGVSVETQKYAPRCDVLARLPAPVKFVSAEPLLGKLDLSKWLLDRDVRWVIVGGESGAGARPMDLHWARSLLWQCKATETAFFLKQLGGAGDKRGGEQAVLDGQLWREYPS